MELPKKLAVEIYVEGAAGGARLLYRFVLTGMTDHDDALKRATDRAKEGGRTVLSANFRASRDQRAIENIVVYVKE